MQPHQHRTVTYYRPSRSLTPTANTHVAELLFTSPEACLAAMLAYAEAVIRGEVADEDFRLRLPSPWVIAPDKPPGITGYDLERLTTTAEIDGNSVMLWSTFRMRWYEERVEKIETVVDGVTCKGSRTARVRESGWMEEYMPFSWSKETRPLRGGSRLVMESIDYVIGDGLTGAEIVAASDCSRVRTEIPAGPA